MSILPCHKMTCKLNGARVSPTQADSLVAGLKTARLAKITSAFAFSVLTLTDFGELSRVVPGFRLRKVQDPFYCWPSTPFSPSLTAESRIALTQVNSSATTSPSVSPPQQFNTSTTRGTVGKPPRQEQLRYSYRKGMANIRERLARVRNALVDKSFQRFAAAQMHSHDSTSRGMTLQPGQERRFLLFR